MCTERGSSYLYTSQRNTDPTVNPSGAFIGPPPWQVIGGSARHVTTLSAAAWWLATFHLPSRSSVQPHVSIGIGLLRNKKVEQKLIEWKSEKKISAMTFLHLHLRVPKNFIPFIFVTPIFIEPIFIQLIFVLPIFVLLFCSTYFCSENFCSTSMFCHDLFALTLFISPFLFCLLFHHDLFAFEVSPPLFILPIFICKILFCFYSAMTFLHLKCPHYFLFCLFLFCYDLFALTLEGPHHFLFHFFILHFYSTMT